MSCILDHSLTQLYKCQQRYVLFRFSEILQVFKPPESAKCTAFTGERSQRCKNPFPFSEGTGKVWQSNSKAEKRMLPPLDAVVLLQFLQGPLLPLSATMGFAEGEVLLERELQTTTFTSLNSPNPFLPAGQLILVFTQRGHPVTLLLMEKGQHFKPDAFEQLRDCYQVTSVVHSLIHWRSVAGSKVLNPTVSKSNLFSETAGGWIYYSMTIH